MTVYFARSGGRIKVGTTAKEVSDRLATISAMLTEPLVLIATIDGDYSKERAIHKRLREFRLNGEWFIDCEESLAIIQDILKTGIIDEPKKPRKPFVPTTQELTSETMRRLITIVWPDDPLGTFAELVDFPRETCDQWLDDLKTMPRAVRYALASAIAMEAVKPQPEIVPVEVRDAQGVVGNRSDAV